MYELFSSWLNKSIISVLIVQCIFTQQNKYHMDIIILRWCWMTIIILWIRVYTWFVMQEPQSCQDGVYISVVLQNKHDEGWCKFYFWKTPPDATSTSSSPLINTSALKTEKTAQTVKEAPTENITTTKLLRYSSHVVDISVLMG